MRRFVRTLLRVLERAPVKGRMDVGVLLLHRGCLNQHAPSGQKA